MPHAWPEGGEAAASSACAAMFATLGPGTSVAAVKGVLSYPSGFVSPQALQLSLRRIHPDQPRSGTHDSCFRRCKYIQLPIASSRVWIRNIGYSLAW